MLLPIMAMATNVSAVGDNTSGRVSTDKTVYAPGEDIKVNATYTAKDCWVGIVPADKNGEPYVSKGSIYWEYVPEEGLSSFSIKEGKVIGLSTRQSLADYMGVTVDEMISLTTGKYFVVHVNSGDSLSSVDPSLITATPFTVSQFSMEKTSFVYGESIPVNALYKNNTNGYIGISHVKDDGSIGRNLRYTYVTDSNVNTTIDMTASTLTASSPDAEKYGRLPAGRYLVYFVDEGSKNIDNRDKRSEVYIDILGVTLEKTEFTYGEPIMVKGYGSGKDWVGIGTLGEDGKGLWKSSSILWRYIEHKDGKVASDGYGSGVAFDLREGSSNKSTAELADIPAGDYVVYVGLDDCKAGDVSVYTYTYITVTMQKPASPKSVDYKLASKNTGMAAGTLTVTFDEKDMDVLKKPSKVELYWADENGDELEGFNRIGSRKITGAVTTIEMTDSLVIPEQAAKLMVRAYNGSGSAEAVAVDLPADRSYRALGKKLASFQIVSDLHVGASLASERHLEMMFEQIKTLDPNSVGIFVAGDAADHGQVAEYEKLLALWKKANENGLNPHLYLGLGNHETMKDTSSHNYSSSYTTQMERFVNYANQSLLASEQTDTPYYYISRGGQHFIFLATEYAGTHAYLSDAQLEWLSDTLAEVASDGSPVFILLHQPLYNTIAGGLANEDGSKRQGWNGVIAGDDNFADWKLKMGTNINNHANLSGQYEAPLREILAKYPSAMMFGGHSHWIMESIGNIYEATDAQPNYMFNTASVSYLWTDNDELNGGAATAEGGQGYFVTVYENCVEFCGRDFVHDEWISNAYYRIWNDCEHVYDNDCDVTCNLCFDERSVSGHVFDDGVLMTDADGKQNGKKLYTCTVCGETKTESVEHSTDTDSGVTPEVNDGGASDGGGMSTGALIAIIAGSVALLGAGAFFGFKMLSAKKAKKQDD